MTDKTDTPEKDTPDDGTSPEPDRVGELEALVEAKDEALKDMRKQRDHWRQHRQSDDEAQAINECVKALDRFTDTSRSSYSQVTYTSTPRVERVLRYLADRYGVTWYTPPAPEPPFDVMDVASEVAGVLQQRVGNR